MNRIRLFVPVVPAMAALLAACQTVPPPASPQLTAARQEYNHAAGGPAGWDAPSALSVASRSLTRAQQANDDKDKYATDYAELARVMGCRGHRITDPDELAPALASALRDRDRPTILDVVTTRDPGKMLPGIDSRTKTIAKDDRPA